MKRLICISIAFTILTGCGGKKPLPATRLTQPTGQFSYVTPDGWYRSKLAGIDFIIVSTDPDHGAHPNIFVEFITPATQLDTAVTNLIETSRNNHRDYEVNGQSDFKTESGLPVVKIGAHRRDKNRLPLATYQYLIQDADRVLVISCTCAAAVKQIYEPIFDSAMRTLESEIRPGRPTSWAQPVDLDGVPNLHKITANVYRGAQPSELGMTNLKQMGIETVINLRSFSSDRAMGGRVGRCMADVHRCLSGGFIHFRAGHSQGSEVVDRVMLNVQ